MRNNTPPFRGKTVVIVGGSKGIGKATAFELVRLGANVCLIARHRALLVKVQQELMNLKGDDEQEIDIISADATIEDELKPALDIYLNEKGCDVLINCVGGARPRYVHDYALADFMKAMEWNYLSAIIPIMTVLPYFLQQGEGHIVNISSIAGYLGMIGYTTYAPTKFAIVGLSEALRHELRPYHIHVSVVYPPDTDTPGLREEEKTKFAELKVLTAKAKLLQPEDVAQALVQGLQHKSMNIHVGSSGWINWVKRHFPRLSFWLLDRELQNARQKLGKVSPI